MKGAGGSLLIIVGLIALWLALTGKLDLFAEFWGKLVASGQVPEGTVTTGGQGKGGGVDWGVGGANESLRDALKKLPNPPHIPDSILNDPIFN
jgi:hypothetical protein